MKINVYSVYDVKVDVYERPFYAKTEEEAIRAVVTEAMREDSMLALYPEDYVLFYLGTFDNELGMFMQTLNRAIGNMFQITSKARKRRTLKEMIEDAKIDEDMKDFEEREVIDPSEED